MRRVALILVIILITTMTAVRVEAQLGTFKDLLLGIDPISLYTYKLGTLVVSKGEQVWFIVLDEKDTPYLIQIIAPDGEKREMQISSNSLRTLSFKENVFGTYKMIVIDSTFNIKRAETMIDYLEPSLKLNKFEYTYSIDDRRLNITINAEIYRDTIFSDGNFYAAILYPHSFINHTNTQIIAIESVEAEKIEKLGLSIIIQEKNENNIIIRPLIYDPAIGFVNATLDMISFLATRKVSFYKIINGTLFIINQPSYLNSTLINKFTINKQYLNLQLNQFINNEIINISISYYNSSPNLSYQYSTKLFINNMNTYFILNLKQLNVSTASNLLNAKGNINIDLMSFLENNSTNVLKDLYLAIIAEKEGIYSSLITKFDQKISFLKIYNNVTQKNLTKFNIIINNGKANIYNDTAILIYKNNINEFILNITNALIPSYLITNSSLKDFELNIIKNAFYKLNITIIAEGLQNPNATLMIYYNRSLLIHNSTNLYGFFQFILPKGVYEIIVLKKSYTTYNETIFLDSDRILIIGLYRENRSNISFDEGAGYGILIMILIIHTLINLFAYRRVKKI